MASPWAHLARPNMPHVQLSQDTFVIGRREDCDLSLPIQAVSGRHCVIERSGDSVTITDTSSNGTRLNNDLLESDKKTPFKHGDEIRLLDDDDEDLSRARFTLKMM